MRKIPKTVLMEIFFAVAFVISVAGVSTYPPQTLVLPAVLSGVLVLCTAIIHFKASKKPAIIKILLPLLAMGGLLINLSRFLLTDLKPVFSAGIVILGTLLCLPFGYAFINGDKKKK